MPRTPEQIQETFYQDIGQYLNRLASEKNITDTRNLNGEASSALEQYLTPRFEAARVIIKEGTSKKRGYLLENAQIRGYEVDQKIKFFFTAETILDRKSVLESFFREAGTEICMIEEKKDEKEEVCGWEFSLKSVYAPKVSITLDVHIKK